MLPLGKKESKIKGLKELSFQPKKKTKEGNKKGQSRNNYKLRKEKGKIN